MMQIPGYEGIYWITADGKVINSSGRTLKPIKSTKGNVVELHKNGQIDRIPIDRLLEVCKHAFESNS